MKSNIKKIVLKILHIFGIKIRNDKKIGVSYSAFNGLEIIEASLRSIRENVDYINVVFQDKSYQGTKSKKSDYLYLEKLKNDGLIDSLFIYKIDCNLSGPLNETKKRNLGLNDLKKNKCDYFLCMDVDECFNKSEFERVKKFVLDNNITSSYCPIYNYIKSPSYRERDICGFYVPFLQKIYKNSKITFNPFIVCKCDPTRSIKYKRINKPYVFLHNEIVLNHFTLVRLDLFDKFNNTSDLSFKKNKLDRNQLHYINYINNYTYNGKFKTLNGDVHDLICINDNFGVSISINNYLNFISNRKRA